MGQHQVAQRSILAVLLPDFAGATNQQDRYDQREDHWHQRPLWHQWLL
jgi:hypothetical protein